MTHPLAHTTLAGFRYLSNRVEPSSPLFSLDPFTSGRVAMPSHKDALLYGEKLLVFGFGRIRIDASAKGGA